MIPKLCGTFLFGLGLGLALVPAIAVARSRPEAAPVPPATPSVACQQAISATEQKLAIPKGLLAAIGMVESGRLDPALGHAAPWPWIINVAGQDHVFMTKDDAVAAVQALQGQGVKSIDVGCVQVNLMWHPDAFASVEQAFDPQANVAYGGRFLRALFGTLGTWEAAAGAYHSQTPTVAAPYLERVLAHWTGNGAIPGGLFPAAVAKVPVSLNTNADVYCAWPPPGVAFAAIPPPNYAMHSCAASARLSKPR